MEFLVEKKDHKWRNTKKLNTFLEKAEPGRYMVKVIPYKHRSLPQNAWLHSVLPEIAQGLREAGYNEVKDEEDAKAVIKSLFFKKAITNGIDTVEVIEGTSAQSKINFAEKADDIIRWASEYLNLDIAPPDTQLTAFS